MCYSFQMGRQRSRFEFAFEICQQYFIELLPHCILRIAFFCLYQEDWNTLQFACSIGDIDSIKNLLEHGLDVNNQPLVCTVRDPRMAMHSFLFAIILY